MLFIESLIIMNSKIIDIVSSMKHRSKEILMEIKQEHIDFYYFIQTQYNQSKGNIKDKELFQNLFRLYYNMGVFLGKTFFDFFFSKLSDKKLQDNIKKISSIDDIELFLKDILKESKTITGKYHYSFVTKLIHIPIKWMVYVVLGITMITYSSLVGGVLVLVAGFVGYTER